MCGLIQNACYLVTQPEPGEQIFTITDLARSAVGAKFCTPLATNVLCVLSLFLAT